MLSEDVKRMEKEIDQLKETNRLLVERLEEEGRKIMKKEKVTKTLRIEQDIYEKIETLAKNNRRSINAEINNILSELLKK